MKKERNPQLFLTTAARPPNCLGSHAAARRGSRDVPSSCSESRGRATHRLMGCSRGLAPRRCQVSSNAVRGCFSPPAGLGPLTSPFVFLWQNGAAVAVYWLNRAAAGSWKVLFGLVDCSQRHDGMVSFLGRSSSMSASKFCPTLRSSYIPSASG